MKSAKIPPDAPSAKGQRVILRGRGATGTIKKIDEGGWVWVEWDEGFKAPDICFQNELAIPAS